MPRRTLTLDNDVAAELAGSQDSVLKALRDRTTSKVHLRGNMLTLEGDEKQMDEAARLVDEMVGLIEDGHEVEPATLDSVTNAIQSTGATEQKQMGQVMGALKDKVAGKADGKRVSTAVKEHLAS